MGKWIAGFLFALAISVITLSITIWIWGMDGLTAGAAALQFAATMVLVAITALYTRETRRQADVAQDSFEAEQESRLEEQQPLLVARPGKTAPSGYPAVELFNLGRYPMLIDSVQMEATEDRDMDPLAMHERITKRYSEAQLEGTVVDEGKSALVPVARMAREYDFGLYVRFLYGGTGQVLYEYAANVHVRANNDVHSVAFAFLAPARPATEDADT